MAVLLETKQLSKVYQRPHGNVVALQPCDLHLAEGEAVAVTGPSGAGKSTLLNLLGGLDNPTSGSLLHRGAKLDLDHSPSMADWRHRVVGFIFQFHFLLPDFTAWENLLIPVRMAGRLDENAEKRARYLLEAMGMGPRMDHLPGELSGGEQQRVAVARAFMNRPEIVLADEPFGNLDHEKGEQLADLLFDLKRDDGTSLVIVTHDLDLAAKADRLLQLEDGRLVLE
jgi:lipoprotein-releasing system ATP-binding protein